MILTASMCVCLCVKLPMFYVGVDDSDQNQSRISGRATNKLWQPNLTRKDLNCLHKTQQVNTQRWPSIHEEVGGVNYTQVKDVKVS